MAAISQTIFSNAFSWMEMYEFRLIFHWGLFLGVQLTISQHWPAPSHYLNLWWPVYWRIYASLGLNELKPSRIHWFYYWNNNIWWGLCHKHVWRAGISNYIPHYVYDVINCYDVITCPCPSACGTILLISYVPVPIACIKVIGSNYKGFHNHISFVCCDIYTRWRHHI